jgi:competence protein ComEA
VDDRRAAWRTFEATETPEPVDTDDPDGRGVASSQIGSEWLAAIPLAWIAAGTAIVGLILVAAAVLLLAAPHPATSLGVEGISMDPSASPGSDGAPSIDAPRLVVEVTGAVAHPGVYHLTTGSRVSDALAAAGGYSSRVDAGRADRALNLAKPLADGDEIRVPSRDDPDASAAIGGGSGGSGGSNGGGGGSGSAPQGPIDLNTATAAQLDTLPGIGPVTAAKILAAREQARFRTVDDLRTRKLLGPATFEKVRPLVVVR